MNFTRRDFLRFQELPQEFRDAAQRAAADPGAQKRYTAQIAKMTKNAKKWMEEHPGADAKIQFNFPDKVGFVCSISEALTKSIVSVNDQGRELLKAMWPNWDDEAEPTVFMYKIALKFLYESKTNKG